MLRLTLTLLLAVFIFISCNQRSDSAYLQTITTSLEAANKTILDHSGSIYAELENKLKDPMTATKAQIWYPKADTVHKLASWIVYRIKNIRNDLQAHYKKTQAMKIDLSKACMNKLKQTNCCRGWPTIKIR